MPKLTRDNMSDEKTVSRSARLEGRQTQSTAITGDIMVPDVSGARRSMEAFEQLKKNLLEEGKDYVNIKGKLAITRAGFSKISLAFKVNTEILKVTRIPTKDDYIVHVTTRAWSLSGRYTDAMASCSKSEFAGGSIIGSIANVEAKAATRSKSRAIADLVGGGVLSSEELDDYGEHDKESETMVTTAQINYIRGLCAKKGIEDIEPYLKAQNKTELIKLTTTEASNIITALQKLQDKKP